MESKVKAIYFDMEQHKESSFSHEVFPLKERSFQTDLPLASSFIQSI
jgi:hypothetical protein